MIVDLYTDAGLKHRVATWAFVLVMPGAEPVEACGKLRNLTDCTATAELRAIANAIHKLVRQGELSRGDTIHVRTDNRHAVERVTGRYVHKPESPPAKAAFVIHKLAEVHGLILRATWVPGHKPDDHSPHARWNNRADALCREARALPRPTPARRALNIARRFVTGAGA